jgi:hypothetical protein
LMSGKISFGVPKIERTPAIRIKMARTIKVYGRRKANWTIHISRSGRLAFRARKAAKLYKLTGRSCNNKPHPARPANDIPWKDSRVL